MSSRTFALFLLSICIFGLGFYIGVFTFEQSVIWILIQIALIMLTNSERVQ